MVSVAQLASAVYLSMIAEHSIQAEDLEFSHTYSVTQQNSLAEGINGVSRINEKCNIVSNMFPSLGL